MPHRDTTKFPVPFTKGLAQSVDPKLAPQGAFVRAENLRYDKDGQVRVRAAYTALTSTGTIYTARMFARGQQFVRIGKDTRVSTIGSHAVAGGVKYLDGYRPARLERTYVAHSVSNTASLAPTDIFTPHIGHASGDTVVAWIQDGAVWAAVYHDAPILSGFSTETGAERQQLLLVPPAKISSGSDICTNLQVLTVRSTQYGSYIHVLWSVAASTKIQYASVTVGTANAGFSAATNLVTDTGSTGIFDVAAHGTATTAEAIVLAYYKNDGAQKLRLEYYPALGQASSANYEVTVTGIASSFNLVLAARPGITPIYVFYNNATNLIARCFTSSALALDSDFPVNIGVTPTDGRLAACIYNYGSGAGTARALVAWQVDSAQVLNQYGTWRALTVDVTGTISAASTYYGGLIASRPFVIQEYSSGGSAQADVGMFICHDNSVDSYGGYSYLALMRLTPTTLADNDPELSAFGQPMAALFHGRVGAGQTNQQWMGHGASYCQAARVVDVSVSGYTSMRFASVHGYINTTQTSLFAWGATDEERIVTCAWDLSTGGVTAWSDLPASAAGYTALSGGMTRLFDGAVMLEPLLGPPHVKTADATTASSGGSIGSGTYQYVFVWEYVDNQGRRHQSGPSPAISVTHASGSANKVTFAIPPLRHVQRGDGTVYRQAYAVGYRTAAGPGSIFYRCSATSGWADNDMDSAAALSWVDVTSDATLTTQDVLYYSQGEVIHEPLPASQHVVEFGGRLCGISSEDRNVIWYTAPLEDGRGPAYSSAFQLRIDGHGEMVALASMDGKLYAFTRTAIILAAYGDGPDKTGGGAPFPEPSLLTTEAGCTDPRSVVLGPDGIYFAGWGDGGTQLYCWRRGDSGLERIGDGVRDELDDMPYVTSAVHVSKASELRFTVNNEAFSTSAVLVYAYTANRDDGARGVWFVHNGDGSGYESAALWNGRYVYAAATSDYVEDTSTQTTRTAVLETGDLWPAGLHGHTRVKATTVFGQTGPAVQNVDVLVAKSNDHGYTYGDSKTFTTSGNTTDDRPWQKRRQWRQQRTVDGSVRFKITLSSDDGGAYDAILSGITVEHLPEPGGVRLGSSNRG